jgi:hypothetical protein
MNITTFRPLAIGTFLLGFLTITASTTSAQPIPIPVPVTPVTFSIPEGPLPEVLQVFVPGSFFPSPPAEIDLFDSTAGGLSDRILLDNSVGGAATITFLSDDEQGNLPGGFPTYPLLIPGQLETAVGTTITFPLHIPGAILPLSVTMVSDGDPTLPPSLSDSLTLTVVPEPTTFFLAAVGFIGLAAWVCRRR